MFCSAFGFDQELKEEASQNLERIHRNATKQKNLSKTRKDATQKPGVMAFAPRGDPLVATGTVRVLSKTVVAKLCSWISAL